MKTIVQFVAIVLAGQLLVAGAIAAEVSYYDGWLSNDYYVDGKKIDFVQFNGLDPLENAVSNNPQALAQFKSGVRLRALSGLFIGVGIGAILFDLTWTLVQGDNMQQLVGHGKLPYDQFHRGVMLGGVASIAVGIPIRVWSHSKFAEAIDTKNGATTSSSIDVYLATNRVGFDYRF